MNKLGKVLISILVISILAGGIYEIVVSNHGLKD